MTSTGAPVALVVEDDPLVRMTAVDALVEAGFEVLEAADADEAATMLSLAPRIDLLITDVRMPGPRDGVELAREAMAMRQDLKVVITSGFSGYEAAGRSPIRGVTFLPKPYTADALIAAAQAELAAPDGLYVPGPDGSPDDPMHE